MSLSEEDVVFDFSWKALKLLGKSLYSNAWSAISELVANGFDAGATCVYILIDVRDKSHATIEIMDDGSGMSVATMRNVYGRIGFDRRLEVLPASVDKNDVMGRKGIGKLAALYLSDSYVIQTIAHGEKSTWSLDCGDEIDPNDRPHLRYVSDDGEEAWIPQWQRVEHGTLIKMKDANLVGFGEKAFESLSIRLANHFLLSSMSGKNIKLCILEREGDPLEFKGVQRSVAYGNMAEIAFSYEHDEDVPTDLVSIREDRKEVQVPFKKKEDGIYHQPIALHRLEDLQDDSRPIRGVYRAEKHSGIEEFLSERPDIEISGTQISIPYRLEGWIGFHATIDDDDAKKNDGRFTKNKFYNPSQIRLYVRNKLAAENVLDTLGITQAFVNYIEGDICFDLLDDNLLPDIATSNRQGFNELDERWMLLKEILRPIVRNLITRRSAFSKNMRDKEKLANDSRESRAKGEATKSFSSQVGRMTDVPDSAKTELLSIYSAQLKGVSAKAKERYTVFLSHQSKDKCLADFFYELLVHRGARPDDFFYTSATNQAHRYESLQPLQDQIRRSIVDENTLLTFIVSPHFRSSEYCLFEAGAGWATRAIGEYQLVATTRDDIPTYLTNNKLEVCLEDGDFELTWQKYQALIFVLNALIAHINHGRAINGESPISEFKIVDLPNKVDLQNSGMTESDYMDKEVVDYWQQYVLSNLDDYRKSLSDERRRKAEASSRGVDEQQDGSAQA